MLRVNSLYRTPTCPYFHWTLHEPTEPEIVVLNFRLRLGNSDRKEGLRLDPVYLRTVKIQEVKDKSTLDSQSSRLSEGQPLCTEIQSHVTLYN